MIAYADAHGPPEVVGEGPRSGLECDGHGRVPLRAFGGRLLVSHAQTVFDENGSLKDEAIRKQLEQFLNGFVQFVQV